MRRDKREKHNNLLFALYFAIKNSIERKLLMASYTSRLFYLHRLIMENFVVSSLELFWHNWKKPVCKLGKPSSLISALIHNCPPKKTDSQIINILTSVTINHKRAAPLIKIN
jgi:hypothetical protein